MRQHSAPVAPEAASMIPQPLQAMLAILAFCCLLLVGGGAASADDDNPCARADERLARTGRGDRDYDGLSNCTEKRVLGTSHRDPDSDDDGVDDGDEIEHGTDPLDDDSDDDGLSDGDEDDFGTNPSDDDTDDDGMDDGDDPDPRGELESEISGEVDSLTCPVGEANGSIVVLAIPIVLPPNAEYDGVESCADLEARIAANGGAFVEVEVHEDGADLVADEVDLEDADHDGSPDDVDDDDDNDGISDDDDDDDDNDGVMDDDDHDHDDD